MRVEFKKVLFLLFIALATNTTAFASDHYAAGKVFFVHADYANAKKEFVIALKNSPSNTNCRYYYAQTLIHLNKVAEAEKEYEKIIETAPRSEAARLSIAGISILHEYKIAQKQDGLRFASSSGSSQSQIDALDKNKVKNSYIYNAVDEKGRVIRWSKSKMPVKVYFAEVKNTKGYNPSYVSIIKSTFKQWGDNSKGLISFQYVPSKTNADIIISFEKSLEGSESGKGYLSGLTKPYYTDKRLLYITIKYAVNRPDGKSVPDNEMYNTSIHEIGHSLGIWGHSSDESDVMYPVASAAISAGHRALSVRDINTLQLLYSISPDLSNDLKDQNNSKSNNNSILGSKDDRLKKKLEESLAYVKKVPDKPISWRHLGDSYKELKNYNQAISSYKKALSIDPNHVESMQGLASVYSAQGAFTQAVLEYKQLIKLDPSNVSYSYNLARLYYDNNQNSSAQSTLNSLIISNPEAGKDNAVKELWNNVSK